MNEILQIILYSSLAGFPVIIGGLISAFLQSRQITLKEEINHWVIAFGGGALLSAIAFALIPRAMENLGTGMLSLSFLAGCFSFMGLDIWMNRKGGSLAQLVSMMMDYVPEALALGASFATESSFGLILALFIGLQNLPEGFSSYIELREKLRNATTLLLMAGLSTVGILAALSGFYFLSDNMTVISVILSFAAGGILYLIFQDIAPLSKRRNDWIPATGACLGFLLGMIGETLIG